MVAGGNGTSGGDQRGDLKAEFVQLSVDVTRLTAMLAERDRQIQVLHAANQHGGASDRMVEDAKLHIETLHRLRAQLAGSEAEVKELSEEGARLTYQVDRLRREQDRYRAVLDEAGEAILVIDCATGLFVDANVTACRWLHRTRDELLGLRASDLELEFPIDIDDDDAAHVPNTRKATRPGILRSGVVRRQDGSTFDVDVSLARRRFDKREFTLVVAREVNARRRAEQALKQVERHYRSLFHLSHDAIYLSARDGTIADANRAAIELFGYSVQELKGLEAQQLYVQSKDIRAFQREVDKHGFAQNLDVEFRTKNGGTFPGLLSVTLRHSETGGVLGYQCIIRALGPATYDNP
jgi:PAS domain S-box-containing protein